MKSLIITAHPSSKGFTHQIADAYKQTREEHGSDAEIINLYDEQWHQDFLRFENVKEDIKIEGTRKVLQEKIAAADELVMVAPVWWFGVPAIMKNFIDQNLTAGFAFSFASGKPEGLLKEKTARVFLTADGPQMFYTLLSFILLMPIKMGTFGFCGMRTTSADIFAEMNKKQDQESRTAMLNKVRSRAQ